MIIAKQQQAGSYYNNLALRAVSDAAAFDELYTYFFPRVYNFLFARLKNVEAADDVVSIAFEKVLRHLAEYNPQKAAFSTWLFRLAANTLTDYYRSKQRKQECAWEEFFDPADSAKTPEQDYLAAEGNAELLRAMDKLSERERRLIALKYWSDLSNKDIAALEGISTSNVGVILFRAIGNLKKLMTE